MIQASSSKQYDLEQRTYEFAKNCRRFVKDLPKNTQAIEDGKQLIRSSGSVAANYIETNESLSKKDFCLRIKVSKKEAKESILWLRLLEEPGVLAQEATELMKIFGSILEKTK